MRKVILLIISIVLLSCNKNTIDQQFIIFLQNNLISDEINNNSFILINSRGCVKCEKQTFYFLIKNIDLLSNYKIIVSANFLRYIEYNYPIPKNIIIDHLNKLESTTLPVNGISILEFKNKLIIGTRSINPLYLQTHTLKEFFNITKV